MGEYSRLCTLTKDGHMDTDTLTKLRLLAPLLNQLSLDSNAECFYEWLSGGLLWKDEIPGLSSLPPGRFEALRGILHYRTALILGESDEQNQGCWLEGERLFPNWPGFAAARRSAELRSMCVELRSKAIREMDEMFDESMPTFRK
jgi:hypothetical protein